jgi:two-component system, NarL family, sensor histidine kinase UhpB
MKLRDLRNSVTVRLMTSAVISLVVVVAGSTVVELLQSRNRIDAEMRSGSELAEMVIGYAMRAVNAESDPEAAARQLAQNLNNMRHVVVQFVPRNIDLPTELKKQEVRTKHPPFWFESLFRTNSIPQLYPVLAQRSMLGTVVVMGYADDEINEIWKDLCNQLVWLATIALMITCAMIWTARLALRPLEAVAAGMDRLSRGEFTVLDDAQVYELRRINERFNTLGASLQRASTDNKILIDRMMALQESEREDIARELHDEIGSALFSLRAELVAWRNPGPEDGAVADRIDGLEAIIEDVQLRNGRILSQLRPVALDHLSLIDALRDLVEAWGSRGSSICWTSEIENCAGRVDQKDAVAIYRVVQECLTNAARHSKARHVIVRVWRASTTRRLHIEIADDGIGCPSGLQMGYGLLGATERVRNLGGTLRIDPNRPSGMILSFSLPFPAEELTVVNLE